MEDMLRGAMEAAASDPGKAKQFDEARLAYGVKAAQQHRASRDAQRVGRVGAGGELCKRRRPHSLTFSAP